MSEKQHLYLLMHGECLIIQSQKQYEEMQEYGREITEAMQREKLQRERRHKLREHMQMMGQNVEEESPGEEESP